MINYNKRTQSFNRRSILWIFPVGRGSSAFLRTGSNHGFIFDMGAGEDCDPAKMITDYFLPSLDTFPGSEQKIAQCVLSHPHSDHIRQCSLLENSKLTPRLLTCPHDKSPEEAVDWTRVKNMPGDENLISVYQKLFESEKRSLPLQTLQYPTDITQYSNISYGIYYVPPPICAELHPTNDNAYVNACSIVTYYRHGQHSVVIPGDITPEALDLILRDDPRVQKRWSRLNSNSSESHKSWTLKSSNQRGLGDLLQKDGLTCLVAPHHGLESCYSSDLYRWMKGGRPEFCVVSERRKAHSNDGNTDGRYYGTKGARGMKTFCDGASSVRNCFTTKDGHHIALVFGGVEPVVYAATDPEIILASLENIGVLDVPKIEVAV